MKKLLLAYKNMLGRCNSKTHQAYKNYGGRGITICQEWKDSRDTFINWALQNGHAENMTLDRIDNNGNYDPANCRWVSLKEQQNNRRSNRLIEFNGEIKNLTQWATQLNIGVDTLKRRIDVFKMPLEKALTSGSLRTTWQHGTRAGYDLHKCKCQECKDMHNKRMREVRAKRKVDLIGYAAIAAELGDV